MAATVHVGKPLPSPHIDLPGQPHTWTPWPDHTFVYDVCKSSASTDITQYPLSRMNHHDAPLKRRRPNAPRSSPVESAYPDSRPPAPSPHPLPLEAHGSQIVSLSPPNDQDILKQAAQILQVPVSQLMQLGLPQETQNQPNVVQQAAITLDVPVVSLLELREQHRRKRTRLVDNDQTSSQARYAGQDVDGRLNPPALCTAGTEYQSWGALAPPVSQPYFGFSGPPRLTGTFEDLVTCVAPGEPLDEKHQFSMIAAQPYYEGDSNRYHHVVGEPPAPVHLMTSQLAGYDSVGAMVRPPLVSQSPAVLNTAYMGQYSTLTGPRPVTTDSSSPIADMVYFTAGGGPVAPYSTVVPQDRHGPEPPPQAIAHVMESPVVYGNGLARAEITPPSTSGALGVGGGEPGASIGDLIPTYDLFNEYSQPVHQIMGNGSVEVDFCGMHPGFELVYSSQRAPPAKRGPFKDHEERVKTAQTRRLGSCVRCRMQRIRCHIDPNNPGGCCLTCQKVANTNKIWRLPCLRLKINNIVLSKSGQVRGFEWTSRWKDSALADEISSWASPETRTIQVTEGFTGSAVALRVRQFVPQVGDSLRRSWVDAQGNKRSVEIPPFAVVDMDATKVSFDKYIKSGIRETCRRLIGPKKELLWRTYKLAMGMASSPHVDAKERELLRSTLELWMSIRLTTTSFEIVGEETLGMSRDIMDETSPLKGKIPLPPVLGAQLDSILIHQIQSKFRHQTLELLQKLTQENKAKAWLTTYLVTFILLHNIALVIRHDAGYARKHGMKRRFAREDKVREYFTGAITLLAYCHYRGGGKIFATETRDDDLRQYSGEEAAQLVAFTRRWVQANGQRLQHPVDDIENEYFFIAQIYEQNWVPRDCPL